MKSVIVVLILALTASGGRAEPSKLDEFVKADRDNDRETAMPPAAADNAIADPKTAEAYHQALQAYYKYRQDALDHRAKVFDWQLISSRMIFIVVVLLVGVGIVFSWLQFRRSLPVLKRTRMRKNDPSSKDAPADVPAPTATTFKASLDGVEISSPVLGVIILGLSLAFFYLYLVYVYPVHNTF